MAKGSSMKTVISQTEWLYQSKGLGLFFLALGFLLYANTLGHDYTQDDAIVIYDNEFTQQGLAGIPDIFRYDTFRGYFKVEGKDQLVTGGRYRPFSLLLFAMEVELFGLNPVVGHLVNALLYGLTAWLLYVVLLQLLKPRFTSSYTHWVAFIATLLFTVHPVHTEVVANIKGRDEMLALLGGLGALYFALRAIDRNQLLALLWSGLCFLIGIFSKENTVTFLAVLPLAVYLFRPEQRNSLGAYLRVLVPALVVTAVFLFVRGEVIGWESGPPSKELMNNPFLKLEGNTYVDFSVGEKTATISYTLGKYLQLLLVPYPLTHDYYPRHVDIMTWGDWQALLSLLLYLGLAILGGWAIWRRKPIAFPIWFYLATLSIVSNIVFPIGTNMAERFLYMPSVAYGLAMGILSYKWIRRGTPKGAFLEAKRLQPVMVGLGIIAASYAVLTIQRNFVWKDNYTLFTTDLAVSDQSAKLLNSVGGEKIAKSLKTNNPTEKTRLLQEAILHLKEALKIHPGYKNAYLLLGNAHVYLESFDQAIQYYDQALKLDSDYPDAVNNRAIAFREAGKFYGEKRGDLNRAIQYLTKALAELPNDYETNRLLGVAYGITGQSNRAVQFFEKAVQLEPNNAGAYVNLGSAYFNAGQAEKGQQMHQKALSLDPNALNSLKSKQ